MPPKQETFYTITAARASDLEHFFAGSIAVGAGERSRSRQRELGRGYGQGAGCEKRAADEQARGVSRWERGSGRGTGRESSDAETGGRRDVKNGRQMSRRGDMRSARGRGGDPEHFFTGNIAVGAGERSRSRQGELGRGYGQGAGCEKRAADEQAREYSECARTRGGRSEHFSRGVRLRGRGRNRDGARVWARGARRREIGGFRGRGRTRF